MRYYIGDHIHIDGRMIAYRLVTANDYLIAKGHTDEEIDEMADKQHDLYQTINQIMAIKQSCWLLRRTSHSCGSLSENLYSLKIRLIRELQEKYNYEFDDEFVERNGEPQKHCTCGKPMIVCYDGSIRHGTYSSYNMTADADHKPTEANGN